MDSVALLYIPKDAPISCQEISRPAGYRGHVIHMHDTHELCFITTGTECQIFSGGNRWDIQGPAIILHRAGCYHELVSISPTSEAYDSRLVYFRTENLPVQFLPDPLFSNDCRIIPLQDAAPYLPRFQQIKETSEQLQQLALLMLLGYLAQEDQSKAICGDAVDSYVFDVIKTIRNRLSENLTVRELAQLYHVSESKLKKDFTATIGTTIKQLTTRLRLGEACDLLKSTRLEVSAIAYRCGFSGESHFIDVFRTHLGITPGKYRKARNKPC